MFAADLKRLGRKMWISVKGTSLALSLIIRASATVLAQPWSQHTWLARPLGYVASTFLVACSNASLVGILSGTRLSLPARRSLARSPNAVGCLPSQAVLPIQSWILHQAQARAPPIQDPATQHIVGDAHPVLAHSCAVPKGAAEFAHRVSDHKTRGSR